MAIFHKKDPLDKVDASPSNGVHLAQDIPTDAGVHQLNKPQQLSLAILQVIHVTLRLQPYTKHLSGIPMVSFHKNDPLDKVEASPIGRCTPCSRNPY